MERRQTCHHLARHSRNTYYHSKANAMTAELGHFSLVLALMIALAQAASITIPSLRNTIRASAVMQAMCLSLAFLCLILVHLDSDFTVANVYNNSHSSTPFLFKISGAWGNHEGSFLLWVWILGLYSAILASQRIDDTLSALRLRALSILGIMQVGFILFIALTSNPFERMPSAPFEGKGLNPLLQDVGLAIHPPMLYFGYVGFGIVFAIGMAALTLGKPIGKAFAQFIHPWILAPWAFLGFGIALGSWWAYRELGWGGWWFWDPVENSSLLPWLAGAALLHANVLFIKRHQLVHWVVLLSIITFSLSLIGTFLVRSGIITSVHSFASDPKRGMFILIYLVLISGSALTLFAARATSISSPQEPLMPVSREGGIVVNNLFLIVATASVLLATLYPMIRELMGAQSISIGAPYFNKTFFPLMSPFMVLLGISNLLNWKNTSLRSLKRHLRFPLLACLVAFGLVYSLYHTQHMWLLLGVTLGVWVVAGTLQGYIKTSRALRTSSQGRVPLSYYGMMLSHIGVGLLAIAIASSSALQSEKEFRLGEGQSGEIHGWTVLYDHFAMERTPSYIAFKPFVTLQYNKQPIAELRPERRLYPVRGTWTTESSIYSDAWQEIYLALRSAGPTEAEKKQGLVNVIALTVYIKPAIPLLWLSMAMIAAGGLFAACTRRHRTQITSGDAGYE
jgi:cytochrome c-type biogenesis protein CcmF